MADYFAQVDIGTRIGGGQFGDVHEAQCRLHGKVAVKTLRQLVGEADAAWVGRGQTLIDEGLRLKSARHKHVVEVLQVVRNTAGVVHLVTEFCDKGSLHDRYEQGPLPCQEVRRITTDVCAGLDAIHSVGMVHRDIKPANILCHGRIHKIGDFGLVTDDIIHGYASADGYISHLAPEVFDREYGIPGVTSVKSDIWALGMTVYRLLHGHGFYLDNFGLMNNDAFEERIVRGGFAVSLPWLPHIPYQWRRFIRQAMNDDASKRFQSAHEMSQALATLPIEPAWKCEYQFDRRVWTVIEDGRIVTVEWVVHSPRKHSWSAIRSGGGKGDRRIAGTNGVRVNGCDAERGLEGFFKNYQ